MRRPLSLCRDCWSVLCGCGAAERPSVCWGCGVRGLSPCSFCSGVTWVSSGLETSQRTQGLWICLPCLSACVLEHTKAKGSGHLPELFTHCEVNWVKLPVPCPSACLFWLLTDLTFLTGSLVSPGHWWDVLSFTEIWLSWASHARGRACGRGAFHLVRTFLCGWSGKCFLLYNKHPSKVMFCIACTLRQDLSGRLGALSFLPPMV